MEPTEARPLAASNRGAMIAAAGTGKTHVIAWAVSRYSRGRELILTHTHAGVDALRRRLGELGADPRRFRLDTIAGWSLRLVAAFPTRSRLPTPTPRTHEEYEAVSEAAARLLGLEPYRRIVRNSYAGVYVDEYQDCTKAHHSVVLGLASILPCRVVGDPLQGIFGFGRNQLVSWEEEVAPVFDALPAPTTPWRWEGKNGELGSWLVGTRSALERGGAIDLREAPVERIDGRTASWMRDAQKACFGVAGREGETAVVIRSFGNQCHKIASVLAGTFSCVEPFDAQDLFDTASRIDDERGFARGAAVLEFAASCMTKIKTELGALLGALKAGRGTKSKKHPVLRDAVLRVADDGGFHEIRAALEGLADLPGAVIYRRELFREMLRGLRAVERGEAGSLVDAVWQARERTRRAGRRLPRCAVGTTLLVKGLEFDHCIVMDADALDARNLYVALTRGSRSLTVVSRGAELRPGEGG
jgi:hypothetical protein